MRNEIIAACAGAAVGALGGYIIFSNKFKKLEEDHKQDIEDLKAYYKEKSEKDVEAAIKTAKAAANWEHLKSEVKKSADGKPEEPKRYKADKGDISKYYKAVPPDEYIAANAPLVTEGSEERLKEDDICVISPEKVGEEDEYDTQSFSYYKDDILTDELDEVIENREEIVGDEFMNYFGVYAEDIVYVVNHPRKTYYEIVLEDSNFNNAES